MATAYSTILKLALPVQGELSGTWGDVVNNNITSMVEEAIAGRKVINTWTTNSHTLTSADGTTAESRAAMLELTDTGTALSGAGTLICPDNSKLYAVKNDTGQAITVKTSAGTGVSVPDGTSMFVFCDGTNVEQVITNFNSLSYDGFTLDFGGAVTTAGAFTTSGANALTLTTTGTTDVTLPTTGTLATLAGTEILTNKTLTSPTVSDPTITGDITAANIDLSGNTTIGSDTADDLTVNALVSSNLLFDDATYDIGASGANRPRTLYLSADLSVGNDASVGNDLSVGNNLEISNDFAVNTNKFLVAGTTGNTSVAGTFSAAGTSTLAAVGMSGNLAINTNKFTVDSATGNTVIAGTLSVTGNLNLTDAVDIADGGTNATTAADARTNLGLEIGTDVQAHDAALDDISGLAVTDGNIIVGDGANWVAESGATARTSLGLTIGTDVQAHDAALDDISALAVTDGNIIVGDGANWVAESGATARTSLGLTIGTDVQGYDAALASIAGLTTSANQIIYTTASDTYAVTSITAFGRSILDDADAATVRSTIDVDQAGTAVALAIALG